MVFSLWATLVPIFNIQVLTFGRCSIQIFFYLLQFPPRHSESSRAFILF